MALHRSQYSYAILGALMFAALLYNPLSGNAQSTYTFVQIDAQFSPATDINDGGTVVGWRLDGSSRGYLWTETTGIQPMIVDPAQAAKFPGVFSGLADFSHTLRIGTTGVIVGTGCQEGCGGTPLEQAAKWTSGQGLQFLGSFAGANGISLGGGVNDSTQIVGVSNTSSPTNALPFIWSSVTGLQPLAGFTGSSGYALGINNHGEVVGLLKTSTAETAFVWSASVGTTLIPGLPETTSSIALAINDLGVVVGRAFVGPSSEPVVFRWSAATGTEDLNAPAGFPETLDLNNDGDIVGTIGRVAYLYHDGTWTTLNDLLPSVTGFAFQFATAINNSGWIVGSGSTDTTERQQGFVLVRSGTPSGDTVPPVLTVPNTITVNGTSPAGATLAFSVSATDNADPSPTVTCDWTSGSTFPLGVTTVHCRAEDSSGNTGIGTFQVTVKGALAQTIDMHNLVVSWTDLKKSVRDALRFKIDFLREGLSCPSRLASSTIEASRGSSGGGGHPISCEELHLNPCADLQDLINYIVKNSKQLPADKSSRLLTDANRIKSVMGCVF